MVQSENKTDIKPLIAECKSSLANATSFLLEKFNVKEGWSDFATNSSGESTSWVTAHVLWQAGDILPKEKRNQSLDALKSQRHDNGAWGFSGKVPTDCDSTIHAVHALKKYGAKDEEVSNAVNYIVSHQSAEGGFRTYNDSNLLASYRKGTSPNDFIGWTHEHVCVTAAALETFSAYPALVSNVVIGRMVTFLLKRQEKEGCWHSYWWRNKYFATARILHILATMNAEQAVYSSERALKWIVNSINDRSFWNNGFDKTTPCVLTTAGCLKSLLLLRQHAEIVFDVVKWLISQQKKDGSWLSPPSLQIPKPNIILPEKEGIWKMGGTGVGSCSQDGKRIYTTALVAGAINLFVTNLK